MHGLPQIAICEVLQINSKLLREALIQAMKFAEGSQDLRIQIFLVIPRASWKKTQKTKGQANQKQETDEELQQS